MRWCVEQLKRSTTGPFVVLVDELILPSEGRSSAVWNYESRSVGSVILRCTRLYGM